MTKVNYNISELSKSLIRPADATGTLLALASNSGRQQTFNVSVAKTVTLPSAGIPAGDIWLIENVGTALVTVQSSSGATLATVQGTRCIARALIATPTTAAHWYVSNPGEQLLANTAGSSTVSGTTMIQSLLVPVGVWTLYGHANSLTSGGGTDTVMLNSIEISSVSGAIQDNESLAVSTYQGIANSGYRTGAWPLPVTLTSATTMYLNLAYARILGTVPTTISAAQRTLRAVRQN